MLSHKVYMCVVYMYVSHEDFMCLVYMYVRSSFGSVI